MLPHYLIENPVLCDYQVIFHHGSHRRPLLLSTRDVESRGNGEKPLGQIQLCAIQVDLCGADQQKLSVVVGLMWDLNGNLTASTILWLHPQTGRS